jgi:hypothetical protein
MQGIGVFDWATDAGVTDPGTGKLAVDVPRTTISCAEHDRTGLDVSVLLTTLTVGMGLTVQLRTDAQSWASFNVSAPVTDHTTWVEIPVTERTGSGTPPAHNADVVFTSFPATDGDTTSTDYGMASILDAPPPGAPPTAAQLAAWLSISATDTATNELLQRCCDVAAQYELGRLSVKRMTDQGFVPPNVLPGAVAHAMLMRAAAMYRRRNSVNGFEGFADLGAVAIRASDPDIERLVDPWRAWAWA